MILNKDCEQSSGCSTLAISAYPVENCKLGFTLRHTWRHINGSPRAPNLHVFDRCTGLIYCSVACRESGRILAASYLSSSMRASSLLLMHGQFKVNELCTSTFITYPAPYVAPKPRQNSRNTVPICKSPRQVQTTNVHSSERKSVPQVLKDALQGKRTGRTSVQQFLITKDHDRSTLDFSQSFVRFLAAHSVPDAQKDLESLRQAVLSEAASHSAKALRMLLTAGADDSAIKMLLSMLQRAKFRILPEAMPALDPPCADALPLRVSIKGKLDPSLTQNCDPVRKRMVQLGERAPAYYPHLFVAARGVGVEQKSGMLVQEKLRAIENMYLTPFTVPLRWLARRLGLVVPRKSLTSASVFADLSADGTNVTQSTVTRIVPTVRLQRNLLSVAELFLPSVSQEPTYEFLIVMYSEEHKTDANLQTKDKPFIHRVISFFDKLDAPTEKKITTKTEPDVESLTGLVAISPKDKQKVHIGLFQNVPWGLLYHFFPTDVVRILPATKDLLRADILTLLGLSSVVVTFIRDRHSYFVIVTLLGTVLVYLVRILLGLRTAILDYRKRVADDKLQHFLGRDEAAINMIAQLAAEERFADVACVWSSIALNRELTPNHIRRAVLGDRPIISETGVSELEDWLAEKGFLRT